MSMISFKLVKLARGTDVSFYFSNGIDCYVILNCSYRTVYFKARPLKFLDSLLY